ALTFRGNVHRVPSLGQALRHEVSNRSVVFDDEHTHRYYRRAASRQNCFSLRSVMRWPLSRSRLISISFNPPSRPAACSALGRPRTPTVVCEDGPVWTIAPARLAASAASLRRFVKMPVKNRWTPLSVRSTPAFSDAGGVRSASISSLALSYR